MPVYPGVFPQAPHATVENGFTPDDAPGNCGCWPPAARASPGGHPIPVMRGYLPALDHGVMDPAPAEERTRHDRYHSAAAVQIPAAGVYQLDPAASTVTFATPHIFGLAPVKGTFRLVSGQITIADPVTPSTVSPATHRTTFATGHPQRDKDVKSARFLHVRDHPPITFRSTQLAHDG